MGSTSSKNCFRSRRSNWKCGWGLNLRTLQELDNIASAQTNHIVFFLPLDIMKPLKGYNKNNENKKNKKVKK